jgi:hypothetical protein
MKKHLFHVIAVMFVEVLSLSNVSAGPRDYLFAGAHPDLIEGDGALFHLRNKPGNGGKLSAYRINMHLDCNGQSYGVQLGDYIVVGALPAVKNGKLKFTFDQNDPFIGTMRVNNEIRFCGLPGLAKCKKNGRTVATFKNAYVQVAVSTPSNPVGEQCTGIVDSFFVTRGSL